MPFKHFSDYDIYYEVHSTGTPLIFLHGLGGSMGQIKAIYEKIRGIQLILIDMKTHGNSTGCSSCITFDNMAADVIAIADELRLPDFFIAGISMGAAISLNILLNYPERVNKVLLIRNAWINKPMDDFFIKLYKITADCLTARNLTALLNTWEYKKFAVLSQVSANSFIQFFSDPAALTYPDKFRIIPTLAPYVDNEKLCSVKKEVMILANHHDPIHPFSYGQFLYDTIPNSKFYEITSKSIDTDMHKEQLNYFLHKFLL
ncbi:alpha/beta hydrolase [[Clostridium] innocuum]|nr:alpha/beta hydrolase [Erysipelotrichaceae bacterium]MCR0381713.1 alpha/beta hydrolase [[Clostridium] innocuum]MCR0413171.1 alpha/beta hydrolase [[Clostridium] innocuum]MCR0533304.1 alpha/beta hydrolase [[Clostridium] innocuum]MCR0537370.1 alpha/beta hydrolase [[Clostridium] innocuum]